MPMEQECLYEGEGCPCSADEEVPLIDEDYKQYIDQEIYAITNN